jgi:Lrp/AsnC family transcriptional regulator, leucine-responsive regulatory protein
MPPPTANPQNRSPSKIDALDRQILEVLQTDARQSTRSIARQVGAAAGTVGERISRLEESGVIKRYAAIVDPAMLGRSLAFVVGLQITQGNDLGEALDELIAIPEVDEVLVLTGRWDLLVLGRVDAPEELNSFITRGLWRSPIFRHSETSLVLDRRGDTY